MMTVLTNVEYTHVSNIYKRFSTAFGHKNDSYPIEYKKGYNTWDDYGDKIK